MVASMLIEFELIHRQQWWPKWLPLSPAAANKIQIN